MSEFVPVPPSTPRGVAAYGAESIVRWLFVMALGCFVLAALTGVLLRYGTMHGLPWDLSYVNVRYAHTHLMYFGWVTPGLFVVIGAVLARRRDRALPRAYHLTVVAALVTGSLAYPPFLVSGYGLVDVGAARLPLSMIASGLVVLAWYAWALSYVVVSWRLPRDLALFSLDAAVLLLVVASAGAWGLAALALSPVAPPALMASLVQFYLDLFSNGWFALALVGALIATVAPAAPVESVTAERLRRSALAAMVVGLLATTFGDLLSWPAALRSAAHGLATAGLALLAWYLLAGARRSRDGAVGLVAALLFGKALVDGALALPALAQWSERSLLQVALLHAYLLGAVSLAIVLLALRAFRQAASGTPFWWFAAAVGSMLLSLVPLTLLWPVAWRGPWLLPVAMWASLPVVLAALALVIVLARARPGTSEARSH